MIVRNIKALVYIMQFQKISIRLPHRRSTEIPLRWVRWQKENNELHWNFWGLGVGVQNQKPFREDWGGGGGYQQITVQPHPIISHPKIANYWIKR